MVLLVEQNVLIKYVNLSKSGCEQEKKCSGH